MTLFLDPPVYSASITKPPQLNWADFFPELFPTEDDDRLNLTASGSAIEHEKIHNSIDDESQKIPEKLSARAWLEVHYERLLLVFEGSTVLVQEGGIVHAFEGVQDPKVINKMARELNLDGDWIYEYMSINRRVLF